MRNYFASFSGVATTVASDLFELVAAAGVPVEIVAIDFYQTTELGDAQDEKLLISLKYGSGSTSGSDGSTITPTKKDPNQADAVTAIERNNTTQAAAGDGSLTTLLSFTWDVLRPTRFEFPEDFRPIIKPEDVFVVSAAAPADSVSLAGVLYFRELA